MAPEQAAGWGVDVRTDIYAVGVMLFELLTGFTPYESDEPPAVLRMHMHSPLPPLDRVPGCKDPAVLKRLEAWIHRCMHKEAAERFQTPAEASNELRAIRPALTAVVEPNI